MGVICQNCGGEIKDINSKFCSNCGASIERIQMSLEEQRKQEKKENQRTLFDIDPKTEALIVYLIPVIGLIAVLLKDRTYDEWSLYNYKQAATLFIVETGLSTIGGVLSELVFPLIVGGGLSVILVIFQIGAAIRAYQGEKYSIPVIKDLTEKIWH